MMIEDRFSELLEKVGCGCGVPGYDEELACEFRVSFSAVSPEHAHAVAYSIAKGIQHLRAGDDVACGTATLLLPDGKPVDVYCAGRCRRPSGHEGDCKV
ncbi:hypothetical protein Lfu02_20530 [Longispora fulva]|uniref:Uncharacterized protein n=1 Tax=Longispora fulva TaxID=619741 RepID=A0A8J7KJ13_9ACTN|nr:hypothetical protein [Longispora fulva]MBG6139935.1 hypothetical protein [Longispora fulva]GIG57681.1 hypothetical protein Lfu02_20530 [Longispora fulva]